MDGCQLLIPGGDGAAVSVTDIVVVGTSDSFAVGRSAVSNGRRVRWVLPEYRFLTKEQFERYLKEDSEDWIGARKVVNLARSGEPYYCWPSEDLGS